MSTFTVKVREIYEQEIEIEAENEDDALCKADKLYFDQEVVLDSLDFLDVEITIAD